MEIRIIESNKKDFLDLLLLADEQESMIDQYYLGDKDEEKLKEGLYTGLLYGLDDPYSRYYTA